MRTKRNCDCYEVCPDTRELYGLRKKGERFEDLVEQNLELCTAAKKPICGLRERLIREKKRRSGRAA